MTEYIKIIVQFLELLSTTILLCWLCKTSVSKSIKNLLILCFSISIISVLGEKLLPNHSSWQILRTLFIYFSMIYVCAKLIIKIEFIDCIFLAVPPFIITACYEILLGLLFPSIITSRFNLLYQLLLLTIWNIVLYIFAIRISGPNAYKIIHHSNLFVKTLMINSMIIIIGISLIYKTTFSSFIEMSATIILFILFIIYINFEFLYTRNRIMIARHRLIAYDNYLPIVNELIEEIRVKQHDYNNKIQSLSALTYTCNDINELRTHLDNVSDNIVDNDTTYSIVKLNLHLLSGLLITKYRHATMLKYNIIIDIKNYYLRSIVPEYQLVDIAGILIDNAIENSPSNVPIYVNIDSKNEKFIIITKNVGPTFTNDLCEKMFSKGYSTKENPKNHGIGLYSVRKQVAEYNGEITVYNETIDNATYLVFHVEI